jgi:hypothetical protein
MNIFNTSRSYAGIAVASVLALGISFAGAMVASAQTVPETTMPALYNSAGMEVNISNTAPLGAGYYYLAPGAQSNTQVYYYGNGTFVDQTTGIYGGSVSDPNGTVGVTLVYGTLEGTTVPGAPNTGVGGNSTAVWMTLIITSVLAIAGVSYLVTRKPTAMVL